MPIILPGNRIKFMNATTAHSDVITGSLHDKIGMVTEDATTASKSIAELKDALRTSQERSATLSTQREDAYTKHGELLMEHALLQKKIEELEQRRPPALHCVDAGSN